MSEDDPRYRVIKITFQGLADALGVHTAYISMLPLAKDLHPVVRKVFKKTIERKTGTVDVDFAKLAIEIRIFVDEPDLQPISAPQQLADLYRLQAAGLLIMIPPPFA